MLHLFAALAIAAAAAAPPPNERPHRSLVVQLVHRCRPGTDCLSSRLIALMKKETERVWSPLDVRIVWIDSTPAAAAAPPGLIVMLEENAYPERVEHDFVLAALTQPEAACGRGLAQVWVRLVEQHVAMVRLGGHTHINLPAALADVLLGRALGRALAHEIGHYLLGTRQHSAHGLMRARFTPQDLLEQAIRPLYALNGSERDGLVSCRTSRETEGADDSR